VSVRFEFAAEMLFQYKSGMVGAEGDAHKGENIFYQLGL
jgi:hypothetical protein